MLLLSIFCIILLSHTIEYDHFSTSPSMVNACGNKLTSLGSLCILLYYKTSAKANKFYSSFKYCCLWWLVPQEPQSPCTLEPQIYFLDFSASNLKKKSRADLFSTKGMRFVCVPCLGQSFYLQHLLTLLFWLLWF